MAKDLSCQSSELRGWSIIVYRGPSSPSTARMTVWKRVKELGAFPLQQSVYILPALPELKEVLKNLGSRFLNSEESAGYSKWHLSEENQDEEMVEGFNALRNQEYEEITEECTAFDHEIDRETRAGKFYFAWKWKKSRNAWRVSTVGSTRLSQGTSSTRS